MWRFKKTEIDFETGLITLHYLDAQGNKRMLTTDAQSRSLDWSGVEQNINLQEAENHVNGCADIFFRRVTR
jgi:hypothetical protein